MFVCFQCEWLPSKKFEKGSYKCNCKQGYEYPFNDNAWYFDGQTMEEEWRKKEEGDPNSRCASRLLIHSLSDVTRSVLVTCVFVLRCRYDSLKCRIGAASFVNSSLTLLILSLLAWTLMTSQRH